MTAALTNPDEIQKFKNNWHLSNRLLGQMFNQSGGWARNLRARYQMPPSGAVGRKGGVHARPALEMPRIISVVAERSALTVNEMLADRREIELVRARHIAMWIGHREFRYSLPTVAKALRRTDHTTVLHGVRKLEEAKNQVFLAWAKDIAKSIRKEIQDGSESTVLDCRSGLGPDVCGAGDDGLRFAS